MKKVLFIGRFNTLFEETNNYLVKYFNVQVCSADLTLVKNMLIVGKPDIILFSVLGVGDEKTGIMSELLSNHQGIPFLCLETSNEYLAEGLKEKFSKHNSLKMPVANHKIVEAVCELLGLNMMRTVRLC